MPHLAYGGPVSGRSSHEKDVEHGSPIVAPEAIEVAHCLPAWSTHSNGLTPPQHAQTCSWPTLENAASQSPTLFLFKDMSFPGPRLESPSEQSVSEQQQDSSSTSPLVVEDSGTLQTSRLRSDSNERVPLTQPWHFPPNIKYHKSTLGSLHSYTQTIFEKDVTEGYIVEDTKGFCFNANGKYLLLHEPDSKQNRGKPPKNGEYLENQALLPQNLFPTPITPRRAALRRRPTTLPPPSPSPPRTPLATPWIFSPDGLYKEAFCAATARRSELDIERDVSAGRLVVDERGIRHPDTNGYILYYTGERDNSEKLYTPRITRLEKPRTPLVETSAIDAQVYPRGKTARINKHCEHVAPTAIVSKGIVVDNECKSQQSIRQTRRGTVRKEA